MSALDIKSSNGTMSMSVCCANVHAIKSTNIPFVVVGVSHRTSHSEVHVLQI